MDLVERLIMFVSLLLAQVLIMNHIHLFQVATPMLCVFFVITFRRNTPKWLMMTWSFVLGLVLDIFYNTPGLAAGSMTLIAMLQPYLVDLLSPRDSAENLKCSTVTLGAANYYLLCVILTFVYCLVFFALEAFSFFEWQRWLLCTFGSTILTLVFIYAIERVRSR